MSDDKRCPCGARIMWCDVRKSKDGVDVYIYTCGICNNQIEFKYDADPTKV